jgi:hypothetical protein
MGLKTLKGGPIKAGRYLCSTNELTSLEGSPQEVSRFSCCQNKLTSLIGAPRFILNSFDCFENPLTSLEGIPERTGAMRLSYSANLPLLRLLKLSSESSFSFVNIIQGMREVTQILRRYKDGSRSSILTCQKELIDAGYEGNASW